MSPALGHREFYSPLTAIGKTFDSITTRYLRVASTGAVIVRVAVIAARAVVYVIQASSQGRPYQCRAEVARIIVSAAVASVVGVGMAPVLIVAAVVLALPPASSQAAVVPVISTMANA